MSASLIYSYYIIIKLYQSSTTNWESFDYIVNSTTPTSNYMNGTYWLDTTSTNWGLYIGNGTVWTSQAVSIVDNANIDAQTKAPISSYAPTNNYSVVSIDGNVGSTYYKKVTKHKSPRLSYTIFCGHTRDVSNVKIVLQFCAPFSC